VGSLDAGPCRPRNKEILMHRIQLHTWIAPLLAAAPACAQLATFDGLAEGYSATVITENGLTFRDLDQRVGNIPPPYPLVTENATTTLAAFPGFSSPNVLDFVDYVPGPICSFGRIGSLRILPPGPRTLAVVEVFELGSGTQNTIALVAYAAG